MKKKIPVLLLSLSLGLIPATISGLTSCETKKAVYSIVVNQVSGATLSVDKIEASEGEIVTLTISNIQKGKEVERIEISDNIELSKVNDTTYTFEMINKEVSVSLVLKDIIYSINVEQVEGVTINVASSSIGGKEVEINVVSLPTGKHIKGFNGVTAEKKEENKYVFIMPFDNVTITPLLDNTLYNVELGETDGATLSLSKVSAIYNETIKITVLDLPKGKIISSIFVGEGINVKQTSTTTFEFNMPAKNVSVSATLTYGYIDGTISYASDANYLVTISNEELGNVDTTSTVTGLAFKVVRDYEYTISITNYDKELYLPSLYLNGSVIEIVDDKATFVANGDLLVFSIVDNLIKYDLDYSNEEIEIENNLNSAPKGSLVSFNVKEKVGHTFSSVIVYTGEKDTDSYEELALTENDSGYKYSFTMVAKTIHFEVSYNLKKVELNFDSNSTSFKSVVKNAYYIENGVKGAPKYLNSTNNDINYGSTLRIYLNDIYGNDVESNQHLKFSLEQFKVNGVAHELVETTEEDAKYYCDVTLLDDVSTIEIVGKEIDFIKNTVSIDRENAASVSIYTNENLTEESKTSNYFYNKKHYVQVSALEGYAIASVKFTYYKYAYSQGSYSKQLVTITPEVNGDIYSFTTNSIYFENYCEITCTITTNKILNYEGKEFVGEWIGCNVYYPNVHDTALKSPTSNYTLNLQSNGTILKNNRTFFTAEYLDETNRTLKETESSTAYNRVITYGEKTLISNDSNTNMYDRIFCIKPSEGTTSTDYKYIAYTFGETGRNYSLIQWFKIDSEGNYLPFAGSFTNNIDNIVYNDIGFEFIVGESLLSEGTKTFKIKDNLGNVITTISADDSSASIISEEDLIERTISTSSVTGCIITPNKSTCLPNETITLTVSNLGEGKVIDKVYANDVECNDNGDGTYSFIAPRADIEITVTYKTLNTITVTESSEATINVDRTTAYSGQTVTISISNITEGKVVDEVSVTGTSGNAVVTKVGDNYQFVMPNEAVNIAVTFTDYVAPTVPFANSTYEGSRTTSDYDYEYDEYYYITDTLNLSFTEDGSKVTVTLTKDNGYSATPKTYENLTYTYVEPTGESTTGTMTIALTSSVTITVTYDISANTFKISDNVTISYDTYYLGPTTLTLKA